MAERDLTQEEVDALPAEVRQAMGLTSKPERDATPDELAATGVAPAPAIVLPDLLGSKKLAAAGLGGASSIPAGGLVADLVSTGLLRANRPGGGVDPAFIAAFPPIGAATTAYRSGVDLLRELSGKRPGVQFTPRGELEMIAQGTPVVQPDPAQDMVTDYRQTRDTRRLREVLARKEEPGATRAGSVAGLIASAFMPGAPGVQVVLPAQGAGTANRILSAIANGGLYGGATAATDGEADLTRGEVGAAAQEVAGRAAGGAVAGGLLSGGIELARPWVVEPLRRLAISQGRQTIQGDSNIAAATREPLADDAVEEVLRSGGIRPFSTTQATAGRIEQLVAEAGAEYGRIVTRLEELGVAGPDAIRLAAILQSLANQLGPRTLNRALPAELASLSDDLLERALEGHARGISPNYRTLSLTQSEDLKRSLQEMARYGRLEETPLNAVRRGAASVLRQGTEDAVSAAGQAAEPGSEIRTLADAFVPVKQRTGRLLEAERFAQRGASKAEQRSPVSLKDLLVGGMAGDPVTGLALAGGNSIARNRLPSTVSSGSYALSQGIQDGTLSPALARIFALMLEPDVTDTSAALAEALRNRSTTKE